MNNDSSGENFLGELDAQTWPPYSIYCEGGLCETVLSVIEYGQEQMMHAMKDDHEFDEDEVSRMGKALLSLHACLQSYIESEPAE